VAGEIAYYFVIPAGSTFQNVFPNAGKTPELDGRDRLFVAIYAGDVRILNYTGGGTSAPGASPQPMTFQNVVCVVPATGEVEVYDNVSKQGMALPPGAQSQAVSADQARATALREATGTDVKVVSTELSGPRSAQSALRACAREAAASAPTSGVVEWPQRDGICA
jgi:hypothetical protein